MAGFGSSHFKRRMALLTPFYRVRPERNPSRALAEASPAAVPLAARGAKLEPRFCNGFGAGSGSANRKTSMTAVPGIASDCR